MIRSAILFSLLWLSAFARAEVIYEGRGSIFLQPNGDVQLYLGGNVAEVLVEGADITIDKGQKSASKQVGNFVCTRKLEPDTFGGGFITEFYCVSPLIEGKSRPGGDACCSINENPVRLAKGRVTLSQAGPKAPLALTVNKKLAKYMIEAGGNVGGFACTRTPTTLNLPLVDQILPDSYLFDETCQSSIEIK